MKITDDLKRFSMIQYNLGYIASTNGTETAEEVREELSDMVSNYITELFEYARKCEKGGSDECK